MVDIEVFLFPLLKPQTLIFPMNRLYLPFIQFSLLVEVQESRSREMGGLIKNTIITLITVIFIPSIILADSLVTINCCNHSECMKLVKLNRNASLPLR